MLIARSALPMPPWVGLTRGGKHGGAMPRHTGSLAISGKLALVGMAVCVLGVFLVNWKRK